MTLALLLWMLIALWLLWVLSELERWRLTALDKFDTDEHRSAFLELLSAVGAKIIKFPINLWLFYFRKWKEGKCGGANFWDGEECPHRHYYTEDDAIITIDQVSSNMILTWFLSSDSSRMRVVPASQTSRAPTWSRWERRRRPGDWRRWTSTRAGGGAGWRPRSMTWSTWRGRHPPSQGLHSQASGSTPGLQQLWLRSQWSHLSWTQLPPFLSPPPRNGGSSDPTQSDVMASLRCNQELGGDPHWETRR